MLRGIGRACLLSLASIAAAVAPARAGEGGGAATSAEPRPQFEVRVARVRLGPRTERWTKAMRYPGDIEETGDIPYSLFHKRIGHLKPGDPNIERQSVRFTRDLVADLRDTVRVACRRAPCSDLVLAVPRRADVYLADRAPRYAAVEHDKTYNHWSWGWQWQVTAGGTTVRAGCEQMRESRSPWCWMALDVGDDLELTYYARTAAVFRDEDITIDKRSPTQDDRTLGKIWFNQTAEDRTVWLVIDGLALSPAPAR
jgi:hypothetical protein